MIFDMIGFSSLGVSLFSSATLVTRRLPQGTSYLLSTIGSLGLLVWFNHEGSIIGSALNALAASLSAWLWWNSGGGDDTKRRLRKAMKKFQPVRRTAPVGA